MPGLSQSRREALAAALAMIFASVHSTTEVISLQSPESHQNTAGKLILQSKLASASGDVCSRVQARLRLGCPCWRRSALCRLADAFRDGEGTSFRGAATSAVIEDQGHITSRDVKGRRLGAARLLAVP